MPAASGVQADGARAFHHSERAVIGSADPRRQEEQREEESTGNGASQIHVQHITDTLLRELRNGKGLRNAGLGLGEVCSSAGRNHGTDRSNGTHRTYVEPLNWRQGKQRLRDAADSGGGLGWSGRLLNSAAAPFSGACEGHTRQKGADPPQISDYVALDYSAETVNL